MFLNLSNSKEQPQAKEPYVGITNSLLKKMLTRSKNLQPLKWTDTT